MVTVVFSNRARRSLLEILQYIATVNPQAALGLIADLEKRVVETLSTFPEAGKKWLDGRRVLVVRRYSVGYRFDAAKGVVVVMVVFSPGMDWR